MTGFDTLIYTDCRPGQGLSGRAGMQFQASSVGWDAEAMEAAQRNLLYEPPARWLRVRRPVSEYPPSFGHVWDGRLGATAAGVYLGREVNGGREGNHLTHCIFTRDANAYRLVRPAQLFRASFWATAPAATVASEPIPADWQPGPFDAVSAKNFVQDQHEGEALLLALLSELERNLGSLARQVLFIATDPTLVVSWLAAATFLLPQRLALKVTFKVFTTNPAYAAQHVIAIHPNWNTDAASVHNELGYVVFDLVGHEWSQVPATTRAKFWVNLFLHEDPYDVVDAIEVADRTGLLEPTAWIVAKTVVLHHVPSLDDAPLVLSWLLDGPSDMLNAYTSAVVRLFMESLDLWPTVVLEQLDQVAALGRTEGQLPRIRLELLKRELTEIKHGLPVRDSVLAPAPPHEWHAEDNARAWATLKEALSHAQPPTVGRILQLSRRFRLDIAFSHLRHALSDFVADWADHPERGYRMERFPHGEQIEDLLRDELNRRLDASSDSLAIGSTWSEILRCRFPESDAPLDAVMLGAQMLHAYRRESVIQRHLQAAAATGSGRQVERTLAALWRFAVPTPSEAGAMCQVLRRFHVGPAAFPALLRSLSDSSSPPIDYLAAAHDLVGNDLGVDERRKGHDLWKPGVEVTTLLFRDRDLLNAIGCLEKNTGTPNSVYSALQNAPERLSRARREMILDGMLRSTAPELVVAGLHAVPDLSGRVCGQLCTMPLQQPPRQIVLAFCLSQMTLPPVVRERVGTRMLDDMLEAVRIWVSRVAEHDFQRASQLMKIHGRDWYSSWQTLAARERKSAGRRDWRRREKR